MATKIPIQVFSKNELDIAYECARALWYGINFKNGKYNNEYLISNVFSMSVLFIHCETN